MNYLLPEALEIGGVRYTIKICYPGLDHEPTSDTMLGEIDNKKALIWLHAGQAMEQMNATFWHEVLHTGEFLLGQPTDGEDLCNLYANIVCQVLKQLEVQ